MRAVVIHAPKDLRIEERDVEKLGAGQVAVRIQAGGICGSDLHYYNHGGFGTVRVREPMILGHEIAGTVAEVAPDVTSVTPGDRVAVNPSRPCRHCRFCLKGLPNQCLNMRFYGSAMPMPHIQGGFREVLVCDATQCVTATRASVAELAMAEPFSVVLHGLTRAGSLLGARVLVTGCGPIGALVVAAARFHGAADIIVTDIVDEPLAIARTLGATLALNTAQDPDALKPYTADKGQIDVMFECSGNERALRAGMEVVRPRGTIVQLGLGGDMSVPQNMVVAKELVITGSFRFHEEFPLAVALIDSGRVDLTPLLTGSYPITEAVTAFERANDRRSAMKVQLTF
ncbi:L-idonate 5-dehydrogenase [Acidisoma cellulosilytica]|uniref:L-idonate 5-dehydrogenase n=1 Tax=Acidisoma cellulosilyticum TaxID=2802395 RepID=A0A963Z7B0_9PROT|nr:L-idonate 5-dehydrogenase [Acidisoma cellulosilyticum]MCB8883430.1 L-idonate 5-dehydrogenase [Acidisoma cellulosilyticum]